MRLRQARDSNNRGAQLPHGLTTRPAPRECLKEMEWSFQHELRVHLSASKTRLGCLATPLPQDRSRNARASIGVFSISDAYIHAMPKPTQSSQNSAVRTGATRANCSALLRANSKT